MECAITVGTCFVIAEGNVQPRFYIGYVYIIKIVTIIKRPIANARHAVANCYNRQRSAGTERRRANARHAIRNRNACQRKAAGKRRRANARHTVANCDAR